MEAAPKKSNPAPRLTEDVLVKILRRLPVRSVCRFKCVSRSWYKLISNPDHRVPQTLAGFFHDSLNGERFPCWAHHFTNVTGKGVPLIYPSFSFLPVPREDVVLIDSCNGLLLCRCRVVGPHDGKDFPFRYVVCNPATKKWLMLPDSSRAADEVDTVCLGFDPTVSSHFHVIQYLVTSEREGQCVLGVEIYSSKTATWSFKESKWGDDVVLYGASSVFLNGFMHILTCTDGIIVVDMEGKTWRKIPMPWADDVSIRGDDDLADDISFCDDVCIHQTQGRLCLLHHIHFVNKLSIWILEDYGTNKWILKHMVSSVQLFRQKNIRLGFAGEYKVITVHPECNLIFFVYGWDNTLMAYEMDRREVRVIRNLEHDSCRPFLSYVPFFSDSLAEEH